MLPISLGIVLVAVAAFLWASKRKQFDDLDTPAKRILLDDPPPPEPTPPPTKKRD
ncbi:MAG: cbb3-type cytochrome oxidase assembly protein CcoS [bacterium]|nr:cbb3-type cytochrome oxidase assembly protein CcoS [bacterium]